MWDYLTVFGNSCFEILSIYFLLILLDKSNRLTLGRCVLFVAIPAMISTVISILQVPYHLVFSVSASILVSILLTKSKALQLIMDIICAFVFMLTFQLFIILCSGILHLSQIMNAPYSMIVVVFLSILFLVFSKLGKLCLFFEVRYQPNRQLICLVTLSLVFLYLVVTSLWIERNELFWGEAFNLSVVTVGYIVVNIILIISLIRNKRDSLQRQMLDEYGDYLLEVNDELRTAIHDHNADLNMLVSIAESSKMPESNRLIIEYIDMISTKKRKPQRTAIISKNKLISAYLLRFSKIAEKSGVDFGYVIARPSPQYPIPGYDLISILNNLTSNAIEAAMHLEKSRREVSVLFEPDRIQVRNPAPQTIDDEAISQFQESGYSTKGDGHGYGLTLVLEIVKRHGFSFYSYIENNETILFEIVFTEKGMA
jgi:signal transduction histidine kinase